MERRLLKASEIHCRVQQITDRGLSLLLYVTSRAGENILDEMYGPENWKREHTVIDGNLYCTISVLNDKIKQCVGKFFSSDGNGQTSFGGMISERKE